MTDITYNDDDLVHVDPEARVVVARVEFNDKGLPKPLERPSKVDDVADDESDVKTEAKPDVKAVPGKPAVAIKGKDRRPPRKPRVRYYPWGTYKTMKKLFKLEGKVPEAERTLTLDDVMTKALQEPYWD